MVHAKETQQITVTQSSPQTFTPSPGSTINIHVYGVGSVTIQFSSAPPTSLQGSVTSNNTVVMPVVGELQIENVTNVTSITFQGNLKVNVETRAIGVINVEPQVNLETHKQISVSVSSGSISSVVINEQPSVAQSVFYVGDKDITFVGSGVSFTVSDYDPVNNSPAGTSITVNLVTQSREAEYPPTGSTLLQSRTGYIYLSNFQGSGTFNIFLSGNGNG